MRYIPSFLEERVMPCSSVVAVVHSFERGRLDAVPLPYQVQCKM